MTHVGVGIAALVAAGTLLATQTMVSAQAPPAAPAPPPPPEVEARRAPAAPPAPLSPPSPPAAPAVHGEAEAPPVAAPGSRSSCKSFENCPILSTPDDTKRFEYYSFMAGLSCKQALEKLGTTPGATDKDHAEVRAYYAEHKRKSACQDPHRLIRGAVDSAVVVSSGRRGLLGQEHGLQILPTFGLGIPFGRDSSTDAGKALKGVKALGGLVLRYSPVSFWASVHGVIGTAQVDASELDRTMYPNPFIVGTGAGIDVLGGILSLTYFRTMLRGDGITSETRSSSGYFNVGIDLTAIGVGIAGLTK